MSLATDKIEHTPLWAWLAPIGAALLLAAKFGALVLADAVPILLLAAFLLFATVFAAVHHAEVVAVRVGEPFGSILLAVAVTIIEVALIVSVMLSAAGSDAVARDTVYSAVMIVLNGVVGLCLLLGGARHHEQSFQVQGASAALGVLGVLATIALVLPNFALAVPGPTYAPLQLIFVGISSLALYGFFVFVQTVRHLDYFLVSPEAGATDSAHGATPSNAATIRSAALLLLALVCVVLLAKVLSPALDRAVAGAGLPVAVVGVVIAALVLLPEGIAAIRAARVNQLQVSLNLALGSALASIGLTIPVVAVVSILMSMPLSLGLASKEMVLLTLTLFSSTLTLATGRTTVLQGAVHLVIFAVFLLLTVVP
jgi:Ca2+:H+ antiporter